MSTAPMWRQVQQILDDEFNPGDDTYKSVAKDIHLLYLDGGWTPPYDNGMPSVSGALTGALKWNEDHWGEVRG